MSIWSTIREIAWDLPLGAVLRVLGVSPARDRTQSVAFTIAVIALSAKMAKADGEVTPDEIFAFQQVLKVPPEEAANVGRFFDQARQEVAGFESYARQCATMFRDRPAVLEDLLDGLFHIAKADKVVTESELAYLARVAELFGFSESEWERIRASHLGTPGDDPYVLIGIDRSASDTEARTAYRRMVRENHPDSLIARGVPQEFIDMANAKLAAINGAWERIARERGL